LYGIGMPARSGRASYQHCRGLTSLMGKTSNFLIHSIHIAIHNTATMLRPLTTRSAGRLVRQIPRASVLPRRALASVATQGNKVLSFPPLDSDSPILTSCSRTLLNLTPSPLFQMASASPAKPLLARSLALESTLMPVRDTRTITCQAQAIS
jgi:hypothetical protein